jgi:hypothetical protein
VQLALTVGLCKMPPQQVAIVTYGHKQERDGHLPIEATLVETFGGDAIMWKDLRRVLPNPAKKMKVSSEFRRDGSFASTIQKVFSQREFADVVCDDISTFTQYPDLNVVAYSCASGFHRADSCGRTCKSLLNSMVGSNNEKLFNAEHFPLCHADNLEHVRDVVRKMQEWIDCPGYSGLIIMIAIQI